MTNRLTWIKRRARGIEQFYGIQRRLAVHTASQDWLWAHGRRLSLVEAA